MSWRGNCHDNAVAESFFNLLKHGRIRRKTYRTCEEARQDMFDYIEMFYNPKRKHVRYGMLSPVEFERQHQILPDGVYKTRGYSLWPLKAMARQQRLPIAKKLRDFAYAAIRNPPLLPPSGLIQPRTLR